MLGDMSIIMVKELEPTNINHLLAMFES